MLGFLRNLLKTKVNHPAFKSFVDLEMADFDQKVINLLSRNRLNAILEMDGFNGEDFVFTDDLFLWGIIQEFLKDRPLLPSGPSERLPIHYISFRMRYRDDDLNKARANLATIRSAVSDNNTYFNHIIYRGEKAWTDDSDQELAFCYRLTKAMLASPRKDK